jgi:hypothetical protein
VVALSGFARTSEYARQRRRVSRRYVQHREGNAQNQHRSHERCNRTVRKVHESSLNLIANMVSSIIVPTSGHPAKSADGSAKKFERGNAFVVMSVPRPSYVICSLFILKTRIEFSRCIADKLITPRALPF